ncbi:MAG UNVERIFIED_CONTAM: dihydroxy-acid dehydratase [Microcystis novacekii LVE1205-3]|jgi:dihydroxy-acid dehydratase
MGTEGMKYSLVSREVIADSIETVCNGQSLDGVLAIGGCDKNMPGAMIAMARMNIPAISSMVARLNRGATKIAI